MERILNIQVLTTLIILTFFLSCITCAYAQDLNETADELNLDSTELEELEIAAPSDEDELNDENVLTSESQDITDSKAYLVLDNDADVENIYIGDYVTWIVSVINKGPDTAKNVKVFDQLPDGLKYIKHTASKGTFNPKTGIWNIGNLTISDGEVFLNITTKAFSSGEKINRATLTSDTYNLNNESYEEEEIDVFEHEAKAFAKKSVDSRYAAGNPIALMLLSILTIGITPLRKSG